MPGPPPKPAAQRRRRNAVPGTVTLPAEGRSGKPPRWPLEVAGDAEKKIWAELWRRPQAVMWERLQVERTVARYCRVLVAAENLAITWATEARQLEDRLGLTPMSMLRLRWEIAGDDTTATSSAAASGDAKARDGSVHRLRAVDPQAG